MKISLRTVVLCLSLFSSALAAQSENMSNPRVQSFSQTFEVPDVSQANVITLIRSKTGKPLYRLRCHSAGFTGDSDFDYSGDFECRLSSAVHKDKYSTLLTEDKHQSRDWESRGRFFASELKGECAKIPNFGVERQFKLRGMDLTLRIIDPQFTDEGELKSLKLGVQVQSDETAVQPIAKAVPVPTTGISRGCNLETHFVDTSTR
jgi:hypothetical protein